jgi:hypothetical protein
MIAEFGIEDGTVPTEYDMRFACGASATLVRIEDDLVHLHFDSSYIESEARGFSWDTGMITHLVSKYPTNRRTRG